MLEGGRKREEDKQSRGQTDRKRLSQYSISQIQLSKQQSCRQLFNSKRKTDTWKSFFVCKYTKQYTMKHTNYTHCTHSELFLTFLMLMNKKPVMIFFLINRGALKLTKKLSFDRSSVTLTNSYLWTKWGS